MPALTLPTVSLMHPTLVATPFHREGWVYEEKYDGWRVVAYKDAQAVRLISRNGKDLTRRFRDLAAAVAALPARTSSSTGSSPSSTPRCGLASSGCGSSRRTRRPRRRC